MPLVSPSRSRGFTIIELLVVVGIIALLVGIILPSLAAAKRRSLKTTELNNLKQVGHAWMLYANSNNDAALPGFLEREVQAAPVSGVSRGWNLRYEYPDGSDIPNTAQNIAGPWTWRLLSYLSYDYGLTWGYRNDDTWDHNTLKAKSASVAYEPAFAYNGYYIGGFWKMTPEERGPALARHAFYDHCSVPTGLSTDGRRITIPLSISQITRSTQMITFCSAGKFNASQMQQEYVTARHLDADYPGAHLVTPPHVGEDPQWRPYPGDETGSFEILGRGDVFAPLPRYTGTTSILYADGHLDSQGYNAMDDPQQWINSAENRAYRHRPCW